MKNYAAIGFCTLLFTITTGTAHALPCSGLSTDLIAETFVIEHSAQCLKKALQEVTFKKIPFSSSNFESLGDSLNVKETFSVENPKFSAGADEAELRLLTRYDRAAIVQSIKSPDTCFLVWFSSDGKLRDANMILSQNASGAISLGSDNKRDNSEYMHLTRKAGSR